MWEEKGGSKDQGPLTLPSTSPKSWVGGAAQQRDSGGGWVRAPSRMTAAQFELLKCRRELLSSPFRVTVHRGKGPVILLSPPHSELPSCSRVPPDGAAAPCERPANTAGATSGKSCEWHCKQQRVQASHGLRLARESLYSLLLSQASIRKKE